MARFRVTSAIAFAALAAFIAPLSVQAEPRASLNDTARFIAGMQPSAGSPLSAATGDAYWKQYAQSFDDAWSGLERRQLTKINALVSKDFTNPQPVLFYFFSGPDFLYADAFFPSATTYVMAGLEPPGQIPDLRKLSRGETAGALRDLRSSLSSVLSYSFFQTKFMRVDFSRAKLNGTLPVLMTFLARSGKTIYDAELFDLQSDGTLHPVEEQIANPTGKGVKITFGDAAVGKKKTLYYFSTDLSDGGIKNSGFLTFCDTLGKGDSFVKSASYLMHQDNFSTVRDYLLKHSASLLEDDSGIPVRFFAQGWQLHPYGRYVGPIGLFAGQYQSKLNEVFGKGRATPIDFSLGYRWKPNESNILRAVKDDTATAFEMPPPVIKASASGDAGKAKVVAAADHPTKARNKYHRRKQETVSNYWPKLFGYAP
ncbi:hypothetical protein [Hyphomicrobium sp.]|uniref:hypothetical protein n=1 Tax=Hyphomicrobium sp. TaxID=82 RepID=UPI000FB17875|nr:hypothetical protein [Hyphomicrobium sp.]RUO97985.1 MAG: hypothetical protein EKK30_14760 [Hyphomicrobium sp.]